LPLLAVCKGKGELQLEEMGKLYIEELKVASAAAKGEHEWKKGEGDHVGTIVEAIQPVAS
jgi:fructose-bisphosphate aldolase class I